MNFNENIIFEVLNIQISVKIMLNAGLYIITAEFDSYEV